MYQAPKLEKFGTFRQLTLNVYGKTVIGDDAIPGIGLDCNPNTDPATDPTACFRS